MSERPLVSIGVPVFNEESGLPAVLESLLAQDYEELQIVVCDNASTDRTLSVAREYAAQDARIEVHDSDENRGATFNFNRCFRLASGRHFTWASGHDTRMPSAIRKCVDALEADSRLVLCYPSSLCRRFDGSTYPVFDDTLETTGVPPIQRLRMTIGELTTCNAVHGVIRSQALARTRLFRRCLGSDHVLLAELSLLGSFHQLDEALFVRAENRPTEENDERLKRTFDMVGVHTNRARARPYTAMGVEHLAGVWHVSERASKPLNAARTALWFWHRWEAQLKDEWSGTVAVQPLVAARRLVSGRTSRPRT